MRIMILVAAISLSAGAQTLEPFCKTGDAACLQQLETAARGCGEVASLRVGVAGVRWLRCGPAEPQWPADGGFELEMPRSFLFLSGPEEGSAYAFGPDEDDPETVLRAVEQVAEGWLFVWSTETGAASMSHWALLDLSRTPFLQATLPESLERRAQALLRKDETLCCRGWIPSVEKGRIVLISSLRRQDDPQATARGLLRATLALRKRGLVLQDLRRRSAR